MGKIQNNNKSKQNLNLSLVSTCEVTGAQGEKHNITDHATRHDNYNSSFERKNYGKFSRLKEYHNCILNPKRSYADQSVRYPYTLEICEPLEELYNFSYYYHNLLIFDNPFTTIGYKLREYKGDKNHDYNPLFEKLYDNFVYYDLILLEYGVSYLDILTIYNSEKFKKLKNIVNLDFVNKLFKIVFYRMILLFNLEVDRLSRKSHCTIEIKDIPPNSYETLSTFEKIIQTFILVSRGDTFKSLSNYEKINVDLDNFHDTSYTISYPNVLIRKFKKVLSSHNYKFDLETIQQAFERHTFDYSTLLYITNDAQFYVLVMQIIRLLLEDQMLINHRNIEFMFYWRLFINQQPSSGKTCPKNRKIVKPIGVIPYNRFNFTQFFYKQPVIELQSNYSFPDYHTVLVTEFYNDDLYSHYPVKDPRGGNWVEFLKIIKREKDYDIAALERKGWIFPDDFDKAYALIDKHKKKNNKLSIEPLISGKPFKYNSNSYIRTQFIIPPIKTDVYYDQVKDQDTFRKYCQQKAYDMNPTNGYYITGNLITSTLYEKFSHAFPVSQCNFYYAKDKKLHLKHRVSLQTNIFSDSFTLRRITAKLPEDQYTQLFDVNNVCTTLTQLHMYYDNVEECLNNVIHNSELLKDFYSYIPMSELIGAYARMTDSQFCTYLVVLLQNLNENLLKTDLIHTARYTPFKDVVFEILDHCEEYNHYLEITETDFQGNERTKVTPVKIKRKWGQFLHQVVTEQCQYENSQIESLYAEMLVQSILNRDYYMDRKMTVDESLFAHIFTFVESSFIPLNYKIMVENYFDQHTFKFEYEEQGNVQGQENTGLFAGNIKVNHIHSIDVRDFAKLLSQASEQSLTSIMKFTAKITCLIAGLCTSTSYVNAISIITNFLMDVPGLFNLLSNRVEALVKFLSNKIPKWLPVQKQSNEPEDDTEDFEVLVGTAVTSTFMETFAPDLSKHFSSAAWGFCKGLRKQFEKDVQISISSLIGAFLKGLYYRMKMAIDEKDVSYLWGRSNPKQWMIYAGTYTNFFNILIQNGNTLGQQSKEVRKMVEEEKLPEIFKNPVSYEDFMLVIEEHLEEGLKMQREYANASFINKINNAVSAFASFVTEQQVKGKMNDLRVPPFSILLYGPPGQGKTTVASHIKAAIAVAHNLDNSSSSTYNWVNNVNFQDMFTHIPWCVILDDIDQNLAPNAAGAPNHAEIWCALVNSKIFAIEKANLNEKGKYTFNGLLALYLTNNFDCAVDGKISDTTAFYRRFNLAFEYKLKPQFQKSLPNGVEGYNPMDTDKVSKYEGFDMYNIVEMKFSGNVIQPWIPVQVFESTEDFIPYIVDKFASYLRDRKNISDQVDNMDAICKKCFVMNTPNKKCKHHLETVEEESDEGVILLPDQKVRDVPFNKGIIKTLPIYKHTNETEEQGAISSKSKKEISEEDTQLLSNLRSYVGDVARGYIRQHDLHSRNFAQAITDYCYIHKLDFKQHELIYDDLQHWYVWYREDAQDHLDDVYYQLGIYNAFFKQLSWRGEGRGFIDYMNWFVDSGEAYFYRSAFLSTLGITCSVLGITLVAYFMRHTFEYQGLNLSDKPTASGWLRKIQQNDRLIPEKFSENVTWTREELIKSITNNMIHIKCPIRKETSGYVYTDCYASFVKPNVIMFPYHLIKDIIPNETGRKMLTMTFGNITRETEITPTNHYFSNDTCLLRVSNAGSKSGLYSRYLPVNQQTVCYDEVILIHPDKNFSITSNYTGVVLNQLCLITNAYTHRGDCGALYIGRKGDSWRIVAMHTMAVMDPIPQGTGPLISQQTIDSLLQNELIESQCVSRMNNLILDPTKHSRKDLRLHDYPKYSEIYSAMSHMPSDKNIYTYGFLPDIPSNSEKIRTKMSLIYDVCKPYVSEYCERDDYWQVPKIKGEMIGDKWTSCYSECFDVFNLTIPKNEYLWMAMIDYLYGIQNLYTDNYGTISDYDTYKGVLFTEINSINMKTSVGPPWNKSKYFYINPYNPDEVLVHPELQKMIDEIELILEKGVPGIYAQCVRKDEPVKYNKLSRIFCCLPYSVNHVMKKYGSCVEMFMRNNSSFFECAVGINMTSRECNNIIDHLRRVDPQLTNVFDADFKRFDKAWSSELFDIVSLTMYAITASINGDALKNFRLVQTLKHTIYNMKGDLFHATWNPSGNQWTVTLNSILVSLMYRYVYYRTCKTPLNLNKVYEYQKNFRTKPIPENFNCTFRANVALMTYGDDNVFSLSKHYTFPSDFEQIFLEELGMTITSASKAAFRPLSIHEISFLKRYFVWNEEIQSYLPPLDMKAIMRMLVCKKESILSDVDHAATAITNALRELVYHGPDLYNRFYNFLVDEVIHKKHPEILNSTFLDLHPFEYWWDLVKTDSFSTWTPIQLPDIRTFNEGEFEYQTQGYLPVKSINLNKGPTTYKMNKYLTQFESENLSKVHIELQADGSTPTTNSETEKDFPNATILGLQTEESHDDSTMSQLSIFQEMPENSLHDYVFRPILSYQGILATSNVFGSFVSLDPWINLLNNLQLAAKIDKFQYIRAEVDVEVIVAVPGNTYGLYAVSALPVGGTPTISRLDEDLHVQNVCQVDHYALIDLAKNNSARLRLPFLWPYDYAELPTGAANSWRLYITCLSPVRTAIAGGYAAGKYTVFFNFAKTKDFRLVTATNQSSSQTDMSSLSYKSGKSKVTRSKLSAAAARIGQTLSLYPDSVTPIVEGLADATLSSFGLSKSNTVTLNHSVVHRSTSSLANCDGGISASPASLLASNCLSADPVYSGGDDTDIMSFSKLFDRYTLTTVASWSSTQILGDTIALFPVTPGYCMNDSGSFAVSPAGYYGSRFTYWMGGMKYWIYIPVSKLHQGTLQILWSPNNNFSPDDTTELNNAIIQVQSNNCLEVTVDFASIRPRRMALASAGLNCPIDFTNGWILIKVVQPLVAQQTTTTTELYVFSKALPNMQFFKLSPRIIAPLTAITSGSYVYNYQIQYQTGGAVGTDLDKCINVDLVTPTIQYPIDSVYSGEIINSARVFLSKPSILKARTGGSIMGINRLGPFIENGNDFLTSCRWALLPFIGVAADEVIQLLPRSPCWLGACRNSNYGDTTIYGDSLVPFPLNPLTYSGPQKAAEFIIPYYTRKKYFLCREAVDDGEGTVIQLYSDVTPNDFSVIPFLSLSSNARVVQFRQIPRLIPTNQVGPAPWFTGTYA